MHPDDFWFDDHERDEERSCHEEDEFVLCCGNVNCLMPGPHFLYECHTVEMLEDAEMEE